MNENDNTAQKNASFKPQVAMGQDVSWWSGRLKQDIILGGYSVGAFSLQNLYEEHLASRNRWSQSNCGFDLARYMYTVLYFVPHPYLDYIVYVDAEYKTMDLFKKDVLHPGSMITHPATRIIRSIRNGGPRRKLPRIKIPRPAHWDDGWMWMSDLAKWGLFAFYISWVDLFDPFIGNLADPNKVRWWSWSSTDNKNADWYEEWGVLQKQLPTQQVTDVYESLRAWNLTGNTAPGKGKYALRFGPFVLKDPYGHGDKISDIYPQIPIFYKSYFWWGGSTTGLKTICDPSSWAPPTGDDVKYSHDPLQY